MTITHQDQSEAELHQKVLTAIQGALREEKEPKIKRILKVVAATAIASILVGLPFFVSFQTQITWVWKLALVFWVIYLGAGFSLMFKPQPRLMVSGLFSPFVIARLFLVSTLATIVQIIICPSFVFLNSPLDWNPLSSLTDHLMQIGGMSLCMGFCGFLFSVVAGGLGISSIYRVARSPDFRTIGVIFSILIATQVPMILVQILSEDLRPFSLFWILGMLSGLVVILGSKWGWNRSKAAPDVTNLRSDRISQ